MKILYRRCLEVNIQHDYYLTPGGTLLQNHRISDLFDIVPSRETARLMRNHKIVLIKTPTGFILFVEAEKLPAPANFVTTVNLKEKLKFTFHWFLKDPFLANYTNQRIIEEGNKIYYFSNRDGSKEGATLYLNKGIVPFGTTYFNEPAYRLGDLMNRSSKTFELIVKNGSKTVFTPADWLQVNSAIINYVNPASKITWQFPRFEHKRNNTTPGETITYVLRDLDGQPVELGLIPGTSNPQNQYVTSTNASESVNYALNFGTIESGKYTLEISETSGMSTREFYLLDPIGLRDLFGVLELFVSVPTADFRFVQKDPVTNRWLLDDPHKVFLVRFKNRHTRWRYLKQDQTLFDEPADPRPLSGFYTGYQVNIAGTPTNMPDPGVTSLEPDIEASTRLVKNIYSKIYLTN